jgi:hypothetical protein
MTKVTIGANGVVEEAGSGTTFNEDITLNAAVNINAVPNFAVTQSGADADITVSQPVTWVDPTTAVGMTASLPTIVAADLGKQYIILKSSGSNPCLVSGATGQAITEGGLLDYEINTSRALTLIASSGSAGVFYWHVVSNTSLDNGA